MFIFVRGANFKNSLAYCFLFIHNQSVNDIERIVDEINKRGAKIIALDGRAAAGKSTLSESLSSILYAPIIHMDDFFLPFDKRSEERLSEPGGNVDYERFISDVIPMLRSGREFSYKKFDCSIGSFSDDVYIDKSDIKIVDGSYAAHPLFGSYYDLLIFKDVDREEQLRRLELRDPSKLEMFKTKWIVMEERYFSHFDIMNRADIVI